MSQTPVTPENPTPVLESERQNNKVMMWAGGLTALALGGALLFSYLGPGRDNPAAPAPTATNTPVVKTTVDTTPVETTQVQTTTTEVVVQPSPVTTTEVVQTQVETTTQIVESTTTFEAGEANPTKNPISDERQAYIPGTAEEAARVYVANSRGISYTDATYMSWLETAKPYLTNEFYQKKKQELEASGGRSWQQIQDAKMRVQVWEPITLAIATDPDGSKIVRTTYKLLSQSGSGEKTLTEHPSTIMVRVVNQGGKWLVAEEGQFQTHD